MQQIRKFAFDVGWVLVSSAVNLVIVFLLRIALARWLGSSDLGLYTMIVTVQEICVLVAGLGISTALVKYVAEYQSKRDKLIQIISSAFIISIIFSLIGSALLYFLSGTLAGLFNMPQLAHLLRILAIALPFSLLVEVELGLANGLRKMKNWASLMILRNCLMILLIITFVLLGFGVEGTVLGILLSSGAACIFGLHLFKGYLHPTRQEFLKDTMKLVSFGSQAFGANAVSLIANRADIIMIGYFLTAAKVGYYSIAVSLSMLFDIIPHAIQRITYPAITNYWYKENHRSLQEMVDKSMKYSACILLPVGLGFGFFAKEITTTVFGTEYIYAVPPFLILLISRLIRGATVQPIGSIFGSRGRPDIGLKIDTLSTALNIGLNVVLIPRYDIAGAAIATTISLLVGAVIFIVLLPRMVRVKIDARWYGWSLGLACVAVAIFWIGTKFIYPYIVGGALLVGYIIVVITLLLTKEDKAMFKSLVCSLVRRT
ncbi:MAG: flippase [Dehalococcoidia bacterium]|nr:MAG: flippase [Dehalococcoidia bacterium]